MSNNTNDANADGGQDGRESIHMANLATIRVNGLQALTPAVKAEIMQYWFEEQLGKMGYEYDVNVSRPPPFLLSAPRRSPTSYFRVLFRGEASRLREMRNGTRKLMRRHTVAPSL